MTWLIPIGIFVVLAGTLLWFISKCVEILDRDAEVYVKKRDDDG